VIGPARVEDSMCGQYAFRNGLLMSGLDLETLSNAGFSPRVAVVALAA